MSWLKEAAKAETFESYYKDNADLLNGLTNIGIEVEGLIKAGEEITNVVVGKIVSLERHPDADRLWVTQTDIGTETLQIVTGADNLKVGDYIPVAVNGATLVNGLKIKKSKMRGLESNGMLCSIGELGLTIADFPEATEEGIYVFTKEHPLGADVLPIMGLREDIADISILSNRPDTNSIMGLAREVCAVYSNFTSKFILPTITLKETGTGNTSDYVSVEIKDTTRCRRFTTRVVQNVKIAPSPQWMRRRLAHAGIRPINNIVDITNYVMLEYGQPLHAFDIRGVAQADGKHAIVIRTASQDEKFTTLDGVERILQDTALLVADTEKAIGIAGVMGGENSKINDDTTTIIFESANFAPSSIRETARNLGIRTDASARFEKGQDPNQTIISINRAMELIELLECGNVVPSVVDVYPEHCQTKPQTITFKPSEISTLLGIDILCSARAAQIHYKSNPSSEYDPTVLSLENDSYLGITDVQLCDILNYFDIAITKQNDGSYQAQIPTFRADITCMADLAEEIARRYGLNNIKSRYQQTLDGQHASFGAGKAPRRHREDNIKLTLAALGYNEALTYPFDSPKTFEKLLLPPDNVHRALAVPIKNPLSDDFSILRSIPLGGLLESLARNYNKGNESATLFELAHIYGNAPNGEHREIPYLAVAAYGADMDFLSLKGDIEELFSSITNRPLVFEPLDVIPSYMHPGRVAGIQVRTSQNPRDDMISVGELGELHPMACKNYDIGTRVYVALLIMEQVHQVAEAYKFKYVAPSIFPSLKRDLAFKVKVETPASSIEAAIREKGGQLLSDVKLFDVYQGEQVGEGFKSVAYSLRFRANDRSLTEDDILKPIKAILDNLEKKLDAQIRKG